MGLDSEVVIRELGGGAGAILVIILLMGIGAVAMVVRALWAKINMLQDRIFEGQQSCTAETRKLQESTNVALSAVDKSLSAIAAAMRERGGRGRED